MQPFYKDNLLATNSLQHFKDTLQSQLVKPAAG